MLPEFLSVLFFRVVNPKAVAFSSGIMSHLCVLLCVRERKGSQLMELWVGYGRDSAELIACPIGMPRPLKPLGSGSFMQKSSVKCAPLEQRFRPCWSRWFYPIGRSVITSGISQGPLMMLATMMIMTTVTVMIIRCLRSQVIPNFPSSIFYLPRLRKAGKWT